MTHRQNAAAGYALGIDIGGRSAKLALMTPAGQLAHHIRVPTGQRDDWAAYIAPLYEAVARLLDIAAQEKQRVCGLGVGVPGLVEDGAIQYVTNLPLLEDRPLQAELSERFGLPVTVDNDVNLAALGEAHFGQGRGVSRCLTVAIGTGIGIGFVVDGRIVRVSHGGLGDAGHIIVHPDATDPCPCGGRGCLESLVAAPALERRGTALAEACGGGLLAEKLRQQGALTAEEISVAARSGNAAAQRVFAEAGRWLGLGLASLCHVFAPQRIVLAGGVAQAGELLLTPARAALQAHGMPFFMADLDVVVSQQPTAAPVIGAATAALLQFG